MKKTYVIAFSIIACVVLYVLEQVVQTNYITKTLIKLILFTAVPFYYLKVIQNVDIKEGLNLKKLKISDLKLGLMLGIFSFSVIIVAYLVLKGWIDFNAIAEELQSKSKITPSNFIGIGLYITIGNSFLEEFFFRGFIFLNLYHQGFKKLAYTYSSVLFGVYHIAIFKTWFDPLLIGLALFGLISVGVIFDWLDTKSDNFTNSWLVHGLADCAIILIGMRMFDMI